MKKRKMNALLSVLLVFSLILGQPMSVFSAELTGMSQNAVDDGPLAALPVSEVVSNIAIPAGESVSENETVPTTETLSEKEVIPAEDLLQALPVEKQDTLQALGFKPMPLDSAMMEEKAALASVRTAVSSMKSGEDYIENELLYLADTEDAALKIAECYGGTLVEYNYGVAVINIQQPVQAAIDIAADTAMPLPAVYPNITYTIYSDSSMEPIQAIIPDTEDDTDIIDTEEVSEDQTELLTVIGGEDVYALNPTDPDFKSQWFHSNMKTVEAWDATRGKGVEVAVIDTGVDYNHPDLAANISGHVDIIGTGDGMDYNGHGTHCAGIIAALRNDIGGVGVAPEAKIYGVRVLDSEGRGRSSFTIMGISAAIAKNVDVISMSLGSIYYDNLCHQMINEATNKGIVVVAAAGNEGVSQKSYPAAYDNVIAVAATTSSNNLTNFSNYGSWVDIAAPGYDIYSTLPGGVYGNMSGTSMACPAVSGTVALILANSSTLKDANNKSTVTKVTDVLLGSAGYRSEGSRAYYNSTIYPMIDAEAATYAVDDSTPQTPTIKFSSGEPTKNVVLAGEDKFLTFSTTSPHAKIYYTINGGKPSSKTSNRYYNGQRIRMNSSGKIKIQAIAVIGTKVSKPFSQAYTFDVKATELYSSQPQNMTCAIGKSIQLNASVYPSYTSNQKLAWSSSDPSLFKVSNTGKVTCDKKAAAGATALITVETTDGSNLKYSFNLKAVADTVDGLTLSANELKMSYWADEVLGMQLAGYRSEYQLKATNTGSVSTTQYLYKSSNPKVASVTSDGWIYAYGKGKAKITVTANDGSGKTAVCNVTVVTPIYRIAATSSTGFNMGNNTSVTPVEIPIATGCSISMKTTINNNSSVWYRIPSNKALVWSSSDTSMVTANNGKIKCNKNATPGKTVTVTATAKDGFGVSLTMRFLVVDKVEKMATILGLKPYVGSITINQFQVGTAISDLPIVYTATSHKTDLCYKYLRVETSNKDVVYRYQEEDNKGNKQMVIAATKSGTSKITYTIPDGSNKKFTATFKVVAK